MQTKIVPGISLNRYGRYDILRFSWLIECCDLSLIVSAELCRICNRSLLKTTCEHGTGVRSTWMGRIKKRLGLFGSSMSDEI